MDYRLIGRAARAAKVWNLCTGRTVYCVEAHTGAPGCWYVAINEGPYLRDDLF